MSNTDFQWALPPATGQPGGQPQQQPASPEPAPVRRTANAPYGFGHDLRPVGSPPFSPYVPTYANPALRDRPPSDWGSDDWVLEGMNKYPDGGVPEGMHVPTEGDIPGIIHGLTRGLGQYAAPGVGMPMITAGMNYNMANKNYAAGYKMQADINRQQAIAAMEISQFRLNNLIRQYGNAYAAYGPDKDGKDAEPEELANRLREIATANNDTMVLNMLDRGDMAGLDRLMKHLDGQGQDLNKTLKLLQVQEAQLKLKAAQDKAAAGERTLDTWRKYPGLNPPAAPTTTAPGAAPSAPASPTANLPAPEADPSDPGLSWPEDNPTNADKPGVGTADSTTPLTTPGTPEQPAEGGETPGQPEQQALATQARAAGAPVMAADEEDQPAAPPAEQQVTVGRKADRLPVMQPSAPAAPQARQPVPQTPPAAPSPTVPVPYNYRPPPSEALAKAEAQNFDPVRIDQLGRDIANGMIKIQDYRAMPPIIQALGQQRRLEIEKEMDRIKLDPNIKGEGVYQALNRINPQFSQTLRTYVNATAKIPASAWHNPVYRDNILALGTKADPTFNEFTYATRAKTLASFTTGVDARNLTAVGTAANHVDTLLNMLPGKPGSGTPIWDYYHNKLIEWGQGANPSQQWLAAWETNADVAANEIARATSGAAPHQTEIDFWKAQLGTARNPAQLGASLYRAQTLLQGRLTELEARYRAGTGRQPVQDIGNLLTKNSARLAGNEKAANDALLKMLRSQQADPSRQLVPGHVEDGWRFKGGDPGDESNWQKVQ